MVVCEQSSKHNVPLIPSDEDTSSISLSFAGCGFLCIYHAGVCAAIKEYAPQLMTNKMYGASAGSIVAAGLICNVCVSEATILMLNAVAKAHKSVLLALSPAFDLVGIVRDGLQRMLPPNAHELCSGRLFISMTRYRDFKNVVVSHFETRDELIQAILCSSFIPFYSGRIPPSYKGVQYCDGGLSDNQPMYDKNTLTVSPFSGESDICPSDEDSASILGVDFYNTSIRCTTRNLFRLITCLFPPSIDICTKICRQGFQDALALLNKKGLAPCVKCLAAQPRLLRTESRQPEVRVRNPPLLSRSSRRRLESECKECHENNNSELPPLPLPPILQKVLDDAKEEANSIFQYLYSFRIIRWSRRLMTPMIVPIEFMLYGAKTVQNYVFNTSTAEFFWKRLFATLDFVLGEIEKHNLLYSSKVSLQLKEMFDMKAKPSARRIMPSGDVQFSLGNDSDSVQQLVNHFDEHDSLQAKFYSSSNVSKSQELNSSGTSMLRKSRPFHSLKRPAPSRKLSRPFSTVIETSESSKSASKAEDSGLSLTEDSSTGKSAKKRDTTTNYAGSSAYVDRGDCDARSTRRNTIAGNRKSIHNSSKSIMSGPAAYGSRCSDSSDNGEETFFVPTRPRSSSSSNAYDGGAEED